MAVSTDIVRSWTRPRKVIRARLDRGVSEPQLLALLMGACLLIFVAQTPALSRATFLDPSVPLEARMAGALMATLFLVPLFAYALAGISHLAARALGGKGQGIGARLALFWAMLAISPAMLFQGLLAGFVGPSTGLTVVGVLVGLGFLTIWLNMLMEVER
jgi:hypothetical protein